MKFPADETLRRFVRETLFPLFAVFAIIVPLRSAVADWNDVPSGSMRPTILEGDRIWVNKLAYGLRVPLTTTWLARWDEPARGDVVTLASPDTGEDAGMRLVKRIIGLPGDRISMSANHLSINGKQIRYDDFASSTELLRSGDRPMPALLETERLENHPHAITIIPGLAGRIDSFREFVVPEGHYFFLGDNRDRSRDARFVGPVPLDDIYGRVTHIALSGDPNRHYRPRFERWFQPLDPPRSDPSTR